MNNQSVAADVVTQTFTFVRKWGPDKMNKWPYTKWVVLLPNGDFYTVRHNGQVKPYNITIQDAEFNVSLGIWKEIP